MNRETGRRVGATAAGCPESPPEGPPMTTDPQTDLTETQKAYNVAQYEMFQLSAYGHHRYHPLVESLTPEGKRQERDYNDRLLKARADLEAALLRLVAEHAETFRGTRVVSVEWLRLLADDPGELSMLAIRPDEREEILDAQPAAGGVVSAAPDQADLRQRIVPRAVRPLDIEHDQLMARAEAEHQARVAAEQARVSADRAAVLLWAADHLTREGRAREDATWSDREAELARGWQDAAHELRRVAAEAQQQEPDEQPTQCWHTEPGTPCDWNVCRQRGAEAQRQPDTETRDERTAAFHLAANYVRGVSADRRFDKASVSTALCVVSDELRQMAAPAEQPAAADNGEEAR